jgi:hypothetical protein
MNRLLISLVKMSMGSLVLSIDKKLFNIILITSMRIISVCPCLKVHNIEVQFDVCIISKPTLAVGKIAKNSFKFG